MPHTLTHTYTYLFTHSVAIWPINKRTNATHRAAPEPINRYGTPESSSRGQPKSERGEREREMERVGRCKGASCSAQRRLNAT